MEEVNLTFRSIRILAQRVIRFIKNLKLVAVDELHYYHGIFGRLVQICKSS